MFCFLLVSCSLLFVHICCTHLVSLFSVRVGCCRVGVSCFTFLLMCVNFRLLRVVLNACCLSFVVFATRPRHVFVLFVIVLCRGVLLSFVVYFLFLVQL